MPRCALNRLLVVVLLFCHVTQCLRSLCLSDSLCHCALTRLLAFCPLGSLSLSYFCFAMPLSQFSTFSALTVHLCSDCAPVSLCICCLCTPSHCDLLSLYPRLTVHLLSLYPSPLVKSTTLLITRHHMHGAGATASKQPERLQAASRSHSCSQPPGCQVHSECISSAACTPICATNQTQQD